VSAGAGRTADGGVTGAFTKNLMPLGCFPYGSFIRFRCTSSPSRVNRANVAWRVAMVSRALEIWFASTVLLVAPARSGAPGCCSRYRRVICRQCRAVARVPDRTGPPGCAAGRFCIWGDLPCRKSAPPIADTPFRRCARRLHGGLRRERGRYRPSDRPTQHPAVYRMLWGHGLVLVPKAPPGAVRIFIRLVEDSR